MEYQKPLISASIGKTELVVCAYNIESQSENSITGSGISIKNCSNNTELKYIGEIITTKVTYSNQYLEIIQFTRLPVGENFQWIEAPVKKNIISDCNGVITLSDEELILDISSIKDSDIKEFEKNLSAYLISKNLENYTAGEFIAKLGICVLKGSVKSKDVFFNIENYTSIPIDGELAQFYDELKQIIEKYKNN